jgi:hypothetical protein
MGGNISERAEGDVKTSGIGMTTWSRQEYLVDGKNSRVDRHLIDPHYTAGTCHGNELYTGINIRGIYAKPRYFPECLIECAGIIINVCGFL